MSKRHYFEINGKQLEHDDTDPPVLKLEMNYPDYELDKTSAVEIDVCAVRQVLPIRVKYDFARNGWQILQLSEIEPPCDGGAVYGCTHQESGEGWIEAGFIGVYASCKMVSFEEFETALYGQPVDPKLREQWLNKK